MGRNNQSTDAFLPLHPETFRILLVLERKEAYGYSIVKELEADPTGSKRMLPANLYRRIRTLLEQGLIEETPGPADSESEERRRYFRLSKLGEQVARAEAHRLQDLLANASGLLQR